MPRWPERTTAERFWAKVDRQSDGCWVWTGSVNNHGYGKFGLGRGELGATKKHSGFAHRIAWKLTNGEIPEGLCVLHRCDNPPCCNPAHLFTGSKAINTADMIAKGRDWQPKNFVGAANARAILTNPKVRQIRRMLSARAGSQREIAKLFGVSKGTISGIASRATWGHVA